MAERVWAVRAQEFIQYDGTNADEVEAFIREKLGETHEWQSESDVDSWKFTYRFAEGAPPTSGEVFVGDYVTRIGEAISQTDFAQQFVRTAS